MTTEFAPLIAKLLAGPLEADEVIAFAKQRLAPYKVPKTVEFVSTSLRNDAMKLNRAALVAERDGPDPDAPPGRT